MRTFKIVGGAFLILRASAVILAFAVASHQSGLQEDKDRLIGSFVGGGFSIAFGALLIASSWRKK